jgi:hypothetical protein
VQALKAPFAHFELIRAVLVGCVTHMKRAEEARDIIVL